ncbi:MAG: DUF262 domain-containing protein [Firmicutes bacterium]|nr:DUF262 domain-containing protein [Bacillota bacterium]
MDKDVNLKPIYELLGKHFIIPFYKRGYRWVPSQVNDLLNDIWEYAKSGKPKEFYCLQPIVVKQRNSKDIPNPIYEVIDGQQRLTTIYIILQYLMKKQMNVTSLASEYGKEIFSVQYETRPASGQFLANIAFADHDNPNRENIDFYYMSLAYGTVEKWFEESGKIRDRSDRETFLRALMGKGDDGASTRVIWYVVGEEEQSIPLFRRLNMGKIPLTNAELIKALFLSSQSFAEISETEAAKRKVEISLFWDNMEQSLGEPDFWGFCTNKSPEDYPTKIELLFDLMAKKTDDHIDPLYTFLYFVERLNSKEVTLWELWLEVENYYLTLPNWARDRDLYHKIGYLIAVGADKIGEGKQSVSLIEYSLSGTKSHFRAKVDELIRKTVNFDLRELSYDEPRNHNNIRNLLLLFNVESVRKATTTSFYPFKAHKAMGWTLEHIHAQNAELMDRTKKEQWVCWLDLHFRTIQDLHLENPKEGSWLELLERMEKFDADVMTWETFSLLANEIMASFTSDEDNSEYDLHNISNLALLGHSENASLNNSVFEVKRRAVINMDKEGKYIPLCSLRVFLKYYHNGQSSQQLYFWSKDDREGYLQAMEETLKCYLPMEAGDA